MTTKDETLFDIIKEENENWSKIFATEIKRAKIKRFSSYWWEEYYSEITNFIHSLMPHIKNSRILEAGSGSGKASLLLGKDIDRTLLDISKSSLKYAKVLAKKYNCKNVSYCEGNIFELPFNDAEFDLVWNIGVLEHYNEREIIQILKEMIRVTKNGGNVIFGVPNLKSGPIIKAALLTKPIFTFLPGYKLGSEKFYSEKILIELLKTALQEVGVKFNDIEIKYLGNVLIMETPKFLIKTIGRWVSKKYNARKFLIMIKVHIV